MNTVEFACIELSDSAANRLSYLKKESALDESFHLMLSVIPGGLRGFQYKLVLIPTSKLDLNEVVLFSSNGHMMAIRKGDIPRLSGTLIDWEDYQINHKRWTYQNPNIKE